MGLGHHTHAGQFAEMRSELAMKNVMITIKSTVMDALNLARSSRATLA
jgi:hypothetical protein